MLVRPMTRRPLLLEDAELRTLTNLVPASPLEPR